MTVKVGQQYTSNNPELDDGTGKLPISLSVTVTGVFREYLNHDSDGPYVLIEFEDAIGYTSVVSEPLFTALWRIIPEPEVRYYCHKVTGMVVTVTSVHSLYATSPYYERVDVTPHND